MNELDDSWYRANREALLKKLTPKERAVFRLVERAKELEEKPLNEGEPKVITGWQGWKTDDLINAAFSGDLTKLPVPRGYNYANFGLRFEYPADVAIIRQYGSPRKYLETHPPRGSFDIRIYDKVDRLLVSANGGSLVGMEKDWAYFFDDEPFPIEVEDSHGFRYKNPACSLLEPLSEAQK